MEKLLYIVAGFIVLSYLSKLFLRYVFPKLLQWYVRRLMNKVKNSATRPSHPNQDAFRPAENPGIDPDAGEYIDYEEIK